MIFNKRTLHSFLAMGLFFASLSSCSNDESKTLAKFQSLELLSPSETGIDFNNALNEDPTGNSNVLSFQTYYNGAGVGVGDFDNDGLIDIVFAGNEVPNKIYKNLGDLKFEDITETSGINVGKTWSTGVSVVDINQDGLLDIYICQGGPFDDKTKKQNLFFINKGNFVFEEKAKEMGLNNMRLGNQAAFLDFDMDGDMDVYLLNESDYVGYEISYVLDLVKDKRYMRNASGLLFRNNGDLTFTNITEEAGVLEQSFGLGVLVTDFNHDNYPDLYVANDYSVPDRLYINQKNGTFKDEITKYTNQISYFSMGCDIADINNDGHLDLAVVDMATSDHIRGKTLMASMDADNFKYFTRKLGYQYAYMFNVFQLNNGNGSFSNIAAYSGLQKTEWSWAALLADLDLDGYDDYFVANGFRKYARDNDFRIYRKKLADQYGGNIPLDIRKEVYDKLPEVPMRNLIYHNSKELKFKENDPGLAYPDEDTYSNGGVYADLDNDGDLELVVSNIDAPAHIIKNNTIENQAGNFIGIELINKENPTLTHLAKIKITYGDHIQVAENAPIRGYLSSVDSRNIFGLADVSKIDKIEIQWPDGNVQRITNPTINQYHAIKYKKESNDAFSLGKKVKNMLIEMNPNTMNLGFQHQENFFDDFATEILLPQKQSTLGPALAISDVNGDGLDDIYIGGAKGQAGTFRYQLEDGTFKETDNTFFNQSQNAEDLDAVFVNPNNDGVKELFVVSGGGGDMVGETSLMEDRFYAFSSRRYNRVKDAFPQLSSNSYSIHTTDLENDGNEEVFICGAAKTGKYPLSEKTRLYSFIDGKYIDVTEKKIPGILEIPLIRDLSFSDINKDNVLDVLVVSEWGSPTLFISQTDGTFQDQSSELISEEKHGWWSSIEKIDVDNDGDDDFILGNFGENLKHKVSESKPLFLYANDFDKNGTLDVVLAKKYKGEVVPSRGRECSSEQMPFIGEKFESYSDFANANITDILGEKSIEESQKFKATDFGSYILRNKDGVFYFEKLPYLAQLGPITSSVTYDINKDGYMDIIAGGNYYDTEYETPRQDASRGVVLLNNEGKGFTALSAIESGLDLNGNFRKLSLLKRKSDMLLVAAENNGPLKIYKLP